MPLPCFCCGTELRSAFPNHSGDWQPTDALTFHASGQYGSEFDPMDGSILEVNICDQCLQARAERVFLVRENRRVEAERTVWTPADDTGL